MKEISLLGGEKMGNKKMRRRNFLGKAVVGTTGMSICAPLVFASDGSGVRGKPAILGGKPIRAEKFPSWPIVQENDEKAWMQVLRAKAWFRMNGDSVKQFEKAFAQLMGSKDCLATANGTSALFAALNALGVAPGDEVIVPPYTFVATVNVVLLQYALPVFVDTDPETFQIDARKVEGAISERTRCVIPVHLGGSSADLDTILAVAKKHKLPVIEDACQAHLAEWKNKKVGTWGDAGCFSFQVTKNLCAGEGGAVISDDAELMDRCFSFHSNGAPRNQKSWFHYARNGTNIRMTEFQGALLLEQMKRLGQQSHLREQNAAYLTEQLTQIPGIRPAKNYAGCTRNAYHLYMFRYDEDQFSGLGKDKFLDALRAEGVPCSSGYLPLNSEPYLRESLYSRGFLAVYPRERIDRYFKDNQCPENDRLCQQAVWFFQTMLLGTRTDMDQIAEAIRKISRHSGELAKSAIL